MAAMTTSESSVERRLLAMGEAEAIRLRRDGGRRRRRGGRGGRGGGGCCRRRGGRGRLELLGDELVRVAARTELRAALDAGDGIVVELDPNEDGRRFLGRLEPEEAVRL